MKFPVLFVVEKNNRDLQLNNYDADDEWYVNDEKHFVVLANYDDYVEIFSHTRKNTIEEQDQMNQLDAFQRRIDTYLNNKQEIHDDDDDVLF